MLATPIQSQNTGIPLQAAEDLAAFRVVTTNDEGGAIAADAGLPGHATKVVGIVLAAGTEGKRVKAFPQTVADNPAWSWEPGATLFLGLDGEVTDDPGIGVFALPVGYAVTPTKANIRIGTPVRRA